MRGLWVCPLGVLVTGLLLPLASRAGEPEGIRVGPKSEIHAIESRIEEFVSAYNAGDVSGLMTVYHPEFVDMSLGTETISGKMAMDSTRDRLEQTFARYRGQLEVETQEIRVAGNMAFDRGTFQVTLIPRSGGEAITVRRRFLEIWFKEEGSAWRVFRAMDNN